MVMTMKLKYMGWVALSGLFAVSPVSYTHLPYTATSETEKR